MLNFYEILSIRDEEDGDFCLPQNLGDAVQRIDVMASVINQTLTQFIEVIDRRAEDAFIALLKQLSITLHRVGAVRCFYLCERTIERASGRAASEKFPYGAYPCLISLYVQFVLYVDFLVGGDRTG